MTYTKDNIVLQPLPINSRFVDISGQVFGRLTVLGYAGSDVRGKARWWVECACGNTSQTKGESLRSGETKSCGCYNIELREARKFTHGKSGTPEHRIWEGMKWRCLNPNNPAYSDYGGRGIVICARWLDGEDSKHGFVCFLEDMGKRPSSRHSIERRDVNGNYEPNNCYWGTDEEQANNKRNSIFLTFRGKTQTLQQWCKELNIPRMRAYFRIKRGWTDPEQIFFAPSQAGRNQYSK